MPDTFSLVVPCYNEAARLDREEFLRLMQRSPRLSMCFVDDGSTDSTHRELEAIREVDPARVQILKLESNSGKGEAVRRGLVAALERGASVTGYIDADLSTPVDEVLRMLEYMDGAPWDALLGSRVRLLGCKIARKAHRHYLGRVFATLASLALDMPVYDTQCGAKLFRRTEALLQAVRTPFSSRWIFDVELLARLIHREEARICEFPLREWDEVAGSKLTLRAMMHSGAELLLLLIRRRSLPRFGS
jgi:dolichyl-phosphate beta-glucosyltransferase